MEFAKILGIAAILAAIVVLEWRELGAHQRRERIAMVALCIIGGVLAVLLMYDRELPGPTQLFESMFKPLAEAFERWAMERSMQP